MTYNPGNKNILCQARHSVKALIIGEGVALGDLAAEAGVHPSTLSLYLQGRLRNPTRQMQIWEAFRKLAPNNRVSMVNFWGPYLSKRIAG